MSQNPSDTPWTNQTISGVPGNTIYNNKKTILCNASLTQFANYMNNLSLPFQYDHAVAIME